jgi:hypothetical protein
VASLSGGWQWHAVHADPKVDEVWQAHYRNNSTPGVVTCVTPDWVWLRYPMTNQARRAKLVTFHRRFGNVTTQLRPMKIAATQ